LDESGTNVGRVKLDDMAAATAVTVYCNVAAMAGSATACNVVAALAGNALQFIAFLRRCCNNATAMASNTLDLATLLRCPAAQFQRRFQRFCFLFYFFCILNNLKREKEWEKERSLDTCSLVSRLRLSSLSRL
jgi:hypothetical protein